MPILLQITLVLAIALLLVPLCKRLNIPSTLGYILTGIIAGSGYFQITNMPELQLQFTQISIFLLLFWLGLQLRPERLTRMSPTIWIMTAILSSVSTLIFAGMIHFILEQSFRASLAIGLAASFSATTLVIQHLNKQDQLATTHGQNSYSILMIQALLSIPFIALIPLLSGIPSTEHGVAYFAVILATFTGLFLSNRYVFQPLYQWIAKSGSHELHIIVALFVTLGLLLLMSVIGVHVYLAALFAGVLLADSDFRPAIESSIKPFLGLFIGLCFISLGLYIDLKDMLQNALFITLGVLALFGVKFSISLALSRFYQQTWRNSSLLAASLAQAGELSFVLLMIATFEGVIDRALLSPLLLIVVISMLLTPIIYWLLDRQILPRLDRHNHLLATFDTDSSAHISTPILLIGFGRFGQMIARILRQQQQSFSVMDSTIEATHLLAQYDIPFYQADATEPDTLVQAGIRSTDTVIVAIDDIEDSMLIVRHLTWNYPDVKIWVRARDRHHAELLQDLGIQHIWRETYHSALNLTEHVLSHLGLEPEQAKTAIQRFQAHDDDLLKVQQSSSSIDQARSDHSVLAELAHLFEQDQVLDPIKSDARALTDRDHNPIDVIRDDLS